MDKFEEYYKNSEWFGTYESDLMMKEAFEAGQQSQQAKVEELQRRNQMLNDNIKEQGQKLVYQNEVIETQAEKLLGLRDEKAELQKRVDKAIRFLVEAELYQSEPNIDLAVKALKGEG